MRCAVCQRVLCPGHTRQEAAQARAVKATQPPQPMTPGRFVGYVLLACVVVFILFPLLVVVVLAGI